MEQVEVVIKLPQNLYLDVKNGYASNIQREKIIEQIKNGIVLQKGHGALLDADQLMNYCLNQIDGHKYADCNVIARFPCVIKADKAGDTDAYSD